MTPVRSGRIALLYERHASTIYRLVNGLVGESSGVIEDACQTAWACLCAHEEVDVERPGAVRWLTVTATREGWKRARHPREHPIGGWLGDGQHERELPEPAGDSSDPCELTIAHEEHGARAELLSHLTPRERRYLGLQALGLSYQEIAEATQSTMRTVERQILRARRKLGVARQ
jgi:RNA polymerase sigma factor (sigma-70 family)